MLFRYNTAQVLFSTEVICLNFRSLVGKGPREERNKQSNSKVKQMSQNYLKYWLNFSLSFRARVREQLAFRPHLFLVLVSSSLRGDSILIHENPANKTFLLHVVMVPFRQRWYSKCLPTAQHGSPEQWSEDLWLLDGEEPGLVSEDRAGVSGSSSGGLQGWAHVLTQHYNCCCHSTGSSWLNVRPECLTDDGAEGQELWKLMIYRISFKCLR